MDTLDTKRMEMFISVLTNREQFVLASVEDPYGAELFEQLGQTIEALRVSAYEQSRGQSSVRESSNKAAAARQELLRQMDTIYQTERVIAVRLPGLGGKFRSPRGLNDQRLLTLARTYSTDALPLKAEFIKRGLAADFIADLEAVALTFRTALDERTNGRGRQVAATAEINRLIKLGLELMREIHLVVRNHYLKNNPKLALWESASHVKKLPRRSRQKKNVKQESDGKHVDDGNNDGDDNQDPPPANDQEKTDR